jgi:hypothetical protein
MIDCSLEDPGWTARPSLSAGQGPVLEPWAQSALEQKRGRGLVGGCVCDGSDKLLW